MNPHDALTSAIVGHLVGDYLLQTDWMALNKKKQSIPCSVHCWLWVLSVMLFSGWFWLPHLKVLVVFLVLLLTHFIQDRTAIVVWWMTRSWKDQTKFVAPPCGPWSVIVVDNVWHIVTLWLVWRFLV